jgi:hypothetical protein
MLIGASSNKESRRFLKKAPQKLFYVGAVPAKPARPSLPKFFATFFPKK